jgi:hypothetical protein
VIIKVRQTRTPGHDHITIWIGKQEGHLANVGQLVMRPDEADLLLAVLSWGTTGVSAKLIVDTDG